MMTKWWSNGWCRVFQFSELVARPQEVLSFREIYRTCAGRSNIGYGDDPKKVCQKLGDS